MKVRYSLLFFMLFVTACGYQLRGTSGQLIRDDLGTIYISGLTDQSDFKRTLVSGLNDQGVSVTDNIKQAGSVLKMTNPVGSSRLVSVNKFAQGVDYSLFLKSKISLSTNAGDVLIKQREIEVRRDLVADPDDALGNDQLETETKLELEQALVNSLLLQLRAR